MPRPLTVHANLAGQWVGLLKPLQPHYCIVDNPRLMWLCECYCGNAAIVSQINLVNHHAQSCGCVKRARVCLLPYADPPQITAKDNLWDLWTHATPAPPRGWWPRSSSPLRSS
jgi:hypothetical protein